MRIINAEPFFDELELHMSQVDMDYALEERILFNLSLHLFPKNNLVNLHNKQMLKSLNSPIA
jgi:hypothetical protein